MEGVEDTEGDPDTAPLPDRVPDWVPEWVPLMAEEGDRAPDLVGLEEAVGVARWGVEEVDAEAEGERETLEVALEEPLKVKAGVSVGPMLLLFPSPPREGEGVEDSVTACTVAVNPGEGVGWA